MNGLTDTILQMMDTTPEPEDYMGEDGLLHCGKCHKPKEAYFPKDQRGKHYGISHKRRGRACLSLPLPLSLSLYLSLSLTLSTRQIRFKFD